MMGCKTTLICNVERKQCLNSNEDDKNKKIKNLIIERNAALLFHCGVKP